MIKFFTILIISSWALQVSAVTTQEQIKFPKGKINLDLKKSKGEFCENLDSPLWLIKDDDSESLKMGPHLTFTDFNKGKIEDSESSSDCKYTFETATQERGIKKTITQTCKEIKDNRTTEYLLTVTDKDLKLDYKVTNSAKNDEAVCYYSVKREKNDKK